MLCVAQAEGLHSEIYTGMQSLYLTWNLLGPPHASPKSRERLLHCRRPGRALSSEAK